MWSAKVPSVFCYHFSTNGDSFMIKGSIVALVTPMEASGEIDWNALTRLVDFHIENGTDAIVSMGTTGESATVNFDEHNEVVVRTISDAAGRIPVIAGTGQTLPRRQSHLPRVRGKPVPQLHCWWCPTTTNRPRKGSTSISELLQRL